MIGQEKDTDIGPRRIVTSGSSRKNQNFEKARGRGDIIAKMTGAIGIKSCPGCKKRQKTQNEKHPYDGTEGVVDKALQAIVKRI